MNELGGLRIQRVQKAVVSPSGTSPAKKSPDRYESSPQTLAQIMAAPPALRPGPPPPVGDLGPGFPSAPPPKRQGIDEIHDLLAGRIPDAYGWTADQLVAQMSGPAEASTGLNVKDLLAVEERLYVDLSPSASGYVGGVVPLFQALGDKTGAYVDLGPKYAVDADHLMREWSGLPLSTMQQLGAGNDALSPVRQALLDRAANKQFPVFMSTDDNFQNVSATDGIATESIASIAQRENRLGLDFPDPADYYNWLVTRLQTQYAKVDPWLYATNKPTHDTVDAMKKLLTPPWLKGQTQDPMGSSILFNDMQSCYNDYMGICGGGQAPTWDTFCNIADGTAALDRDLVSGIQTYWIKMLRQLSEPQRDSVYLPIARAWVGLNTLPPDDPNFSKVSPDTAPYGKVIDRQTVKPVKERYDRAMAIGEAVDHTLDGMGIRERRDMVSTLMGEIDSHRDQLNAREARLRTELGSAYSGLDINGLLDGTVDGSDPGVQKALAQLQAVANSDHTMTTQHAEVTRHQDLMNWVANRNIRYGEIGLDVAKLLPGQLTKDPLIMSEFYIGNVSSKGGTTSTVTPLGNGPSRMEIHGKADGKPPTPMSIVLQGGGGKGFAFAECLRQTKAALDQQTGQTAIDEFVGNSAGALTAGLLAAGYSPDELAKCQSQLDFKEFYGDYLWLMGGVDPKVRGVDRTGLFSQQKMYHDMEALLQAKCPVQGRPVLFRDLPFKLKVTSTVINDDLPADLKKQLGVGPDGQVVFSSDTTPNMDVAAALGCSAAVPGFFNAPQLQIFRQDKQSTSPSDLSVYRMQMVDGGTVNNFPVHEVSEQTPAEKQALVVFPAYYEGPNASGGTTSLSTLNFDQGDLDVINKYNDQRYPDLLKGLPQFIDNAKQDGAQRIALGYHLTDMQSQTLPAVQGRTRADSTSFSADAAKAGFQVLSPQDSATLVTAQLPSKKLNYAEQVGLNALLGENHVFVPMPDGKTKYHPPIFEAEGMGDMGVSVAAASTVASQDAATKQFEQG